MRLSNYLMRLFARDALGLLGIALTLLFLIQSLRIIDSVSVRGQGLGALLLQVGLAMPTIGTMIVTVAIAIGLARGLRAMQASQELHILHAEQRLVPLLGAISGYAVAGAVLVLVLAHVVTPLASQASKRIRTEVAAQLISQRLVPHRFTELDDGVTVTIDSRRPDGQITGFFADDHRIADSRRTYIADTATLTSDGDGYILRLAQGSIQYRAAGDIFSNVSFARYDVALERLTGDSAVAALPRDSDSLTLIAGAMASGDWPADTVRVLVERSAEGVRVLALCLFIAGIAAFPSGRRTAPRIPVEILVLLVAFLERGLASYLPARSPVAPLSGAMLLIAVGLVILVLRLRLLAPPQRRVRAA